MDLQPYWSHGGRTFYEHVSCWNILVPPSFLYVYNPFHVLIVYLSHFRVNSFVLSSIVTLYPWSMVKISFSLEFFEIFHYLLKLSPATIFLTTIRCFANSSLWCFIHCLRSECAFCWKVASLLWEGMLFFVNAPSRSRDIFSHVSRKYSISHGKINRGHKSYFAAETTTRWIYTCEGISKNVMPVDRIGSLTSFFWRGKINNGTFNDSQW